MKIYQKHSGRRLLLRQRVEPLKKFLEYLFPAKSILFIAVSHTRDTDHGVGSNFIPTMVKYTISKHCNQIQTITHNLKSKNSHSSTNKTHNLKIQKSQFYKHNQTHNSICFPTTPFKPYELAWPVLPTLTNPLELVPQRPAPCLTAPPERQRF